TLSVLSRGPQKFQVAFQDILDAEKNVAESRSPHQRGEGFAVVRDSCGDGLAQRLEAPHVQRYVIVDQENRSSAVIAGIANVRQHAVERVSKEVAAAHLDDGTETAIVGAAARGLDYVHLPAEQRISLEHACI